MICDTSDSSVTTTGTADVPSGLLLNVDQVADLLGISRRSVWRLRSAGELPAVEVSGATRWRHAAVRQFVEGL